MHQFPPLDLALTAVLVASKAECTYKKIRNILTVAMAILSPESKDIDIKEEHRQRVTRYEFEMLQAIEFAFVQRHPHVLVISICKGLNLDQELAFKAMEIVEEWYLKPLPLLFPSHYLAIAALLTASRHLSSGSDSLNRWRRYFDITSDDIRDIDDVITRLDRLLSEASPPPKRSRVQ